MPVRFLAVDLPPLIRDLFAMALLRRGRGRDGAPEAVYVDLPASGGDLRALAAAIHADVVVLPLSDGAWPGYCASLASRHSGLPLLGLGIEDGRGRISEVHKVEIRREDHGAADFTVDELVEHATRAAEESV
jgi:hypothetical protein